MSDASDSVISLQPGGKGDETSTSSSETLMSSSASGVSSRSHPSQNAGEMVVEPKAVPDQEGRSGLDPPPQIPSLGDGGVGRGRVVLTEDRLKKMLYTSCSSESPEFGPIINLYMDQVKSRSCDSSPLETILEYSGLYSKLDLNNFVRLGPSAIGYPSASWTNVADEDKGIEVQKNDTLDTEQTQMKLKLWITRETHPTLEDIHSDIVLKIIIVEEVNKKEIMGSLRAYLTPEGNVEFHTGSPGQKEGLEDYLRPLLESVDTASSTNELDLKTVISAITGNVFETIVESSGPSSEPHDEMKPCRVEETSKNKEVVDGVSSSAAGNVPGPDDEISGDIQGLGSHSLFDDDCALCNLVTLDNPNETLENVALLLGSVSKTDGNVLETTGKMMRGLGQASQTADCTKAVKPPVWHQGVDLTEIFSETESSDDGIADKNMGLLTGADLKILQLLRSSSSGDSDVSNMSAYSDDDIEAGLHWLNLEKNDEEDDSTDDDCEEGDITEKEYETSEEDEYLSGRSHIPYKSSRALDKAGYSALRSWESPNSMRTENVVSLKDLGLQVIDPMGLDVITNLMRKLPDELQPPKKRKGKSRGKQEKSFINVVESTKPQTSPVKPEANLPEQKETSTGRITKSVQNDDNKSSLLDSLESIADALLSDAGENKDGAKTTPNGHGSSQKDLPEKTVPPILGKMPEPAPHGFSRHLASPRLPGPTFPVFGPNHPAYGPMHPALGVPLVKTNQWFPLLLNVPNQGGHSMGRSHNFQPQPPTNSNFRMDIFSKWPEEFGRHVGNSLSLMDIESRVQAIKLISDVLHEYSSGNVDRVAPQNGSNPAQRVQFNPVRPSTRPPFSQHLFTAANQNMNSQPNFGPQNWPPAAFPQMQLSQPQLSSAAQNYPATGSYQTKNAQFMPLFMPNPKLNLSVRKQIQQFSAHQQYMSQYCSSPNPSAEGLGTPKSVIKTKTSVTVPPGFQALSSKSPQSSTKSAHEKSKTKATPAMPESGKTAKIYWEGLKTLKATKKAAKKAQGDPKFSGAVKNKSFNIYPSSRKSGVSRAKRNASEKKTATQPNQNLSHAPNPGTTHNPEGSSSSALPDKEPNQAKLNQASTAPQPMRDQASKEPPQPSSKLVKQTAKKLASQASNQPPKKPNAQSPPKKPSAQSPPKNQNQNQGPSKPKRPSNQPPAPNPGSKPPSQTSKETETNGNMSRKQQRAQAYPKKK